MSKDPMALATFIEPVAQLERGLEDGLVEIKSIRSDTVSEIHRARSLQAVLATPQRMQVLFQLEGRFEGICDSLDYLIKGLDKYRAALMYLSHVLLTSRPPYMEEALQRVLAADTKVVSLQNEARALITETNAGLSAMLKM